MKTKEFSTLAVIALATGRPLVSCLYLVDLVVFIYGAIPRPNLSMWAITLARESLLKQHPELEEVRKHMSEHFDVFMSGRRPEGAKDIYICDYSKTLTEKFGETMTVTSYAAETDPNPDGLTLHGFQLNEMVGNKGPREDFGYGADEFLGGLSCAYRSPEDEQRDAEFLRRVAQTAAKNKALLNPDPTEDGGVISKDDSK